MSSPQTLRYCHIIFWMVLWKHIAAGSGDACYSNMSVAVVRSSNTVHMKDTVIDAPAMQDVSVTIALT